MARLISGLSQRASNDTEETQTQSYEPAPSTVYDGEATVSTQAKDVPVKQNTPPRRFAYGQTRIGGAVFFQDNNNPFMFIGVALSDGEINSVENIYFGNEVVPSTFNGTSLVYVADAGTRWAGRLFYEYDVGTASQDTSEMMDVYFPSLGSTFRQYGVARAVVGMDWGLTSQEHSTIWGNSIVPSFDVKGVKCYDPRTATFAWTKSGPLQVAHALTNLWGAPMDSDYIDYPSVAQAANYCALTVQAIGGATFTAYTSSGVFTSGQDYGAQIANMLASFDGAIFMREGKYVIKVQQAEECQHVLTDADLFGLSDYSHEAPQRNNYTSVKTRYYDTTDSSEEVSAVFEDLEAVAREGWREKVLDVQFCDNHRSAQILAYRAYRRIRAGRECTVHVSDVALWFSPCDRVDISNASFPFLNGSWVIEQIDVEEIGATLKLREYAADAYVNTNTYVE